MSWLFSSGTLTGQETRAGRPDWAGDGYVFLSKSHLLAINWTNKEVVNKLLERETLQSKHILCSASMLGILDRTCNEEVPHELIINGRDRFEMTRAAQVSDAKVISLQVVMDSGLRPSTASPSSTP